MRSWKLPSGTCSVVLAVLSSSGCASTVEKDARAGTPSASGQELRARASSAYDQKQYSECARLHAEADRSGPAPKPWDAYGAACCRSLAGDRDGAFASLGRAVDLGFRDRAHLEGDEDLASLHGDPRWAEVVAKAQARQDAYLKTVNAELFQIYQADQSARTSMDPKDVDWSVVEAEDARRRERVRQILDGGGAKVSDDYFHAAMVFQHGKDVADYQKSHQLCLKAVELDPENKVARWLAAASKDRELVNLGKPQLYGTQYALRDGKWILHEVDPSTTDEERAKWMVPPLEQAKKRAEAMNAGK